MAKGAKQETRKTVWRGISVKAETRPSQESGRTSVSWDRPPLSPLAQQEHVSEIKSPLTEDSLEEPSSSVSSIHSSSHSSSRKERLAGLGSLTKTVERSKSALERKERKEREKQERQERKDQEKLEKQRKEQQKKELKEQAKLLKEQERKDRKSKTRSSLFSRSVKSNEPLKIDIISNGNVEDKPKSPLERRSLLSFGRHSLASLASKPSNASTTDVVVSESTQDVPESSQDDMPKEIDTDDDSGSEEFVDVDSQISIHSNTSTSSAPHDMASDVQQQQQQAPSLPQHSPPRAPTLLEHLQQQTHLTSSHDSANSSTSSITSSNSKHSATNSSMLFILNSLQDVGRDIEDDDLLDDLAENKMKETQRQQRQSRHQKSTSLGQHQFDQHIQELEIMGSDSFLPVPQQSHRHTKSFGDIDRLSMDSYHSTYQQQHYSPSLSGQRLSRCSSTSSYDTVAEPHIVDPTISPHYEITAITEEDLNNATLVKTAVPSQMETDLTTDGNIISSNDTHSIFHNTDNNSFKSADIPSDVAIDEVGEKGCTLEEGTVEDGGINQVDQTISNIETEESQSAVPHLAVETDTAASQSTVDTDTTEAQSAALQPSVDKETAEYQLVVDTETTDLQLLKETDTDTTRSTVDTETTEPQSAALQPPVGKEIAETADLQLPKETDTNTTQLIVDKEIAESQLVVDTETADLQLPKETDTDTTRSTVDTETTEPQSAAFQPSVDKEIAESQLVVDTETADLQLAVDTAPQSAAPQPVVDIDIDTETPQPAVDSETSQPQSVALQPSADKKTANPQLAVGADTATPHSTVDTETTEPQSVALQLTIDTEGKDGSPTDIDRLLNAKTDDRQQIEDQSTVKTPSTINNTNLDKTVGEHMTDIMDDTTTLDNSNHESPLLITTSCAIPSTPPGTVNERTATFYSDRPTSPSINRSPSSSIAAAAAITASKRSSLMSTKRSSTPSISTLLEQHSPGHLESPLGYFSTTSTPIGSSMYRSDSNLSKDKSAIEDGIAPNFLDPREQEEADQPIRQGMNYLFGNKFTKAMSIFKSKAESEPLHALGLGSMLFLKVITYNEHDVDQAMESLNHSYTIASAQADLSKVEKSFDDTFSSHFSSLMANTDVDGGRSSTKSFTANGVLRAQVIQAESCLLMGILQLTQETMTGYLKCGLNFRKACASYSLVWKEYLMMGDQVTQWMDQDTALAVQFGVGTLHLLLSSLPDKIVKIFPGLVWKKDRALGLTLLKSVMTGKGTRSSFGSLILLSYYSLLSSLVPSIYAQESIQPTIECLVAAQKSHPKSCFFLYYAARISRVARNVGLSTQSFTMATTSTRKAAWAEVAMKHTVAYEVGLNHAMQLDWDTSAAYFEQLCCARDWSPAFCQYFVGACYEMLGQRQEAKDAFDEVPVLSHQQHHRKSLLDNYVQCKVERYQDHDYRDLDSSLPGLELLLLLNAFASMEDTYLKRCLEMVQETLQLIKIGGMVDDNSDDDESSDGSDYDNNNNNNNASDHAMVARYGTLLLIKCAVLNALSRYHECIPDLDWLMAKKHRLESEDWLLPFVYWETGVTYWGMGEQQKSQDLWQLALSYTRYDFEFRMASRIHLAMVKCDELGLPAPIHSVHGRKRI
ncbi:hypothetical protein BC941DRAFT_430121 [Chlamydoabsidia padenii]|nr:hypothetical protein BC941DRAFT_430121 [Chlamydoabsidia padenii]